MPFLPTLLKLLSRGASDVNYSLTLLDLLPCRVAMDHVLGFLDCNSILTLRKVCKDMRHFIDNNPRDIKLSDITISIPHDQKYFLVCDSNENKRLINVEYIGGGKKCQISMDGEPKKRKFKKTKLQLLKKDLEIILYFQKSPLNSLTIILGSDHKTNQNAINLLDIIHMLFSSQNTFISVRKFLITAVDQSQILKVLPYLKSGDLEELTLSKGFSLITDTLQYLHLDVSEVVRLEQWKQLKNVLTPDMSIHVSMESIIHLKSAKLKLKMTWEDMLQLKEMLLSNTELQNFYLEIDWISTHPMSLETIIGSWGQPAVSFHRSLFCYLSSVPKNRKKVLLIKTLWGFEEWWLEKVDIENIAQELLGFIDNPPLFMW